ncbi:MAG: peptide-methionine (R)-S-oxide reductase MsrB [Flavobacteriales bacterium]|nr:peptide-methionine (R)-S-oxide reductase MsrB [Flavobacteriales bacterium]
MKIIQIVLTAPICAAMLTGCSQTTPDQKTNQIKLNMSDTTKIQKTEDEWKSELTSDEFRVLREHGTERAFTGEFHDNHDTGVYSCAGCGSELFTSETKFDSGTGWPSYYKPANETCVEETVDKSVGMVRTEVHCAKCGGHLGHKFDDGPNPTGLRYCINSVSLDFQKK